MTSLRVTNWLLLGVFLVLLAHLLVGQGSVPPVGAETLKLDQCITSVPNAKPSSYVHVVTHNFAGD